MTFSVLSNNRWIRIGLVVAMAFLLLLGALAYLLVDTRKVTDIAVSTIQHATGRNLKVNGAVSLQLFPNLSVVADDVRLGNASWAADSTMVTADHVAFSLAWAPLLRQNISITEVQLQGVTLNLQVAPAGQKDAGNWILASSNNTDSTTGDSDAFQVQSLQLLDAKVNFRDGAGTLKQSMVVDRLTSSLTTTQVDFNGRVNWQQQPIDLNGRVVFQADAPFNLTLGLQADRLDLRTPAVAESAKSSATNPSWLFGTEPLGFDLLPQINGTIEATLKKLILPSGVVLPNFSTRVLLDTKSDGTLTLDRFKAGLGQGVVNADGRITGHTTPRPQVMLRAHGERFTLEQIIAQLSPDQKSSDLRGGSGEFAFTLNASGSSMRELVSSMNGEFQAAIGSAQVSTRLVNAGGDFAMSLMDAVNPLRKSSDTTQLQCAVAYLPVKNGLVSIAQSVGIETDRLNLILDGQANLKNENLNIQIYPKEKSGLTTGVNPAGLVQINGTLRNPQLGVNKSGVVKQAATVGLAVVTAGISLAAQNVASIATRSSPCQNVLRPWSNIDGQLSAR